MRRRERAFGTNRDMAHSNQRPAGEQRISDRALVARARREAEQWQRRLEKDRRAERTLRASR